MNVFQCPLCGIEISSQRPLSVVKRQHVAECAECRELVGEVLAINAELLAACEAIAHQSAVAPRGRWDDEALRQMVRQAIANAKGNP